MLGLGRVDGDTKLSPGEGGFIPVPPSSPRHTYKLTRGEGSLQMLSSLAEPPLEHSWKNSQDSPANMIFLFSPHFSEQIDTQTDGAASTSLFQLILGSVQFPSGWSSAQVLLQSHLDMMHTGASAEAQSVTLKKVTGIYETTELQAAVGELSPCLPVFADHCGPDSPVAMETASHHKLCVTEETGPGQRLSQRSSVPKPAELATEMLKAACVDPMGLEQDNDKDVMPSHIKTINYGSSEGFFLNSHSLSSCTPSSCGNIQAGSPPAHSVRLHSYRGTSVQGCVAASSCNRKQLSISTGSESWHRRQETVFRTVFHERDGMNCTSLTRKETE
ncbi:hypothetical protein Q8A73_009395 [Channa argus]|nr:hypothetical protein Q8A73_009395 [Channa argus]